MANMHIIIKKILSGLDLNNANFLPQQYVTKDATGSNWHTTPVSHLPFFTPTDPVLIS